MGVTILNVEPTADAGGPYATAVDEPVTLTGTGSDVNADSLSYAWDLDNDGTFEESGQEVTFVRSISGTYPVVLQVQDDDGGTATATTTVEVNGIIPVAWLSLPYLLMRRLIGKRKKASKGYDNKV
jgi:hypothetical protein